MVAGSIPARGTKRKDPLGVVKSLLGQVWDNLSDKILLVWDNLSDWGVTVAADSPLIHVSGAADSRQLFKGDSRQFCSKVRYISEYS